MDIRFRHLDPMATPQPSVVSIVQDEIGFVWFGTDDGLFRYDGNSFRTYRPIPFDSTSLSDPWINRMSVAGDAQMWLTTISGGLNRYDAMEDRFVRYPDRTPVRTSANVIDADSILWIATRFEGLVRFDPKTGESRKIRADADDSRSLPSDQLIDVMIGRDGVLWVATYDGGICQFDRDSLTCRTYQFDPADPASIPSNRVQALVEDPLGRVWVGTSDDGATNRGLGGVARFDAQSDSFIRYEDGSEVDGTRNVLSLLAHPNGDIFIGSTAGLDRLDTETGDYTSYRHSVGNRSTISAGSVSALYLDNDGVIWVATESGACYFSSKPSPFQHITYNPDDANSLNSPDVWSVFEDANGILWVGTDAGLNRVDRRSGTITRYSPDSNDPNRLLSRLVMGINQTEAMASGDRDRVLRASYEVNLSPTFRADDRYPEFAAMAAGTPVPPEVVQLQLQAIFGHDTNARLPGLAMPTLVIHGSVDRVLPVANGRLIASLVPGSRLEVFEDLGHMFWWEQPGRSAELIREHALAAA